MNLLGHLHARHVFGRRIRVLAEHLADIIPQEARVLDVGCGDGSIAALIAAARSDIAIEGIDVLLRPDTKIPVAEYDGKTIPYDTDSFDVVMFVDVLHHTNDPEIHLKEAKRVAKQAIVLKDHTCDGLLAGPRLRFMDWAGNAPHGVKLPYNYYSKSQWGAIVDSLQFRVDYWSAQIGLYPWPASLLFDSKLHFIARLTT